MGFSVEELEDRIEKTRSEFKFALRQLEREAKAKLDWKPIVAQHAGAFLAAAFLTGVWLGGRRPRPR